MKTQKIPAALEAGFTLIEVMIAASIFTIGSLGILAMVGTSVDLNRQSRQTHEATILASWKMERLATVGIADAELGCSAMCYQTTTLGTTSSTKKAIRTSDVLGQAASSSIYYEVTTVADSPPSADLSSGRRITIAIYWPRDPIKQTLPDTDPAFLDCSLVANAALCHKAEFHTYRKF